VIRWSTIRLDLAFNGSGFAAVLDPKNGLTLKYGFQQSNLRPRI
jgi:hypothetical protein